MSSPNDPGEDATVVTSGKAAGDGTESPPWQRAAARSQQPGARAGEQTARIETGTPAPATSPVPPAPPTPTATPAASPAAPAPGAVSPVDTRVSRYITGTAAPAAFQPAKPIVAEPDSALTRTEVSRPVEYASELPDLSGPLPRPAKHQAEVAPAPPEPAPRAGSRIQVGPRAKGGPVRATMQIRRVDPWSALKVSALLSVALFFVWMFAVAFLYLVLGGRGVWSKLNSNVGDLLTSNSGGGELVSAGSIFGGALLIGLVNIVLFTAMATIGAFVYNLSTDIVGGVEVTLADRD